MGRATTSSTRRGTGVRGNPAGWRPARARSHCSGNIRAHPHATSPFRPYCRSDSLSDRPVVVLTRGTRQGVPPALGPASAHPAQRNTSDQYAIRMFNMHGVAGSSYGKATPRAASTPSAARQPGRALQARALSKPSHPAAQSAIFATCLCDGARKPDATLPPQQHSHPSVQPLEFWGTRSPRACSLCARSGGHAPLRSMSRNAVQQPSVTLRPHR